MNITKLSSKPKTFTRIIGISPQEFTRLARELLSLCGKMLKQKENTVQTGYTPFVEESCTNDCLLQRSRCIVCICARMFRMCVWAWSFTLTMPRHSCQRRP